MSRRTRPVRLAIEGLPAELASLKIGCLYAILVDQRAVQEALVIPTLVDALEAKQPVVLVAPFANASVLDPIAFAGLDATRLLRDKRLRFLRIASDGPRRMRAFGMAQVLDEFDHYGVLPGGAIIAVPGDALFPHEAGDARPGQAPRMLRDWLRATESTMLVVLENPDQGLLTEGGFDGVARLRVIDGDLLHWSTDFWRLPGGDSISSEFRLRRREQGGLAVDTRIATGDARYDAKSPEAADQARVIATTGVVRGERRVPASWELVDSLDALLVRAGNASSANCILETDSPSQFRDVAMTVHQLRLMRGPALKIIVYEIGARLRRAQEQLLLAMGANVVVIGSGLDRLQSVIDTLRGQRYTRKLPADFDEAFAGSLPQVAGGYLMPKAFCVAALEAGERASALHLESVLVQMRLRPGIDPLEALSALRVNRQGDYYSYAEGSIWLYLFGCWESDAEQVLTRLSRRPIGDLFSNLSWQLDNAAAIRALEALQVRATGQIFEDYGLALAVMAGTEQAAPALAAGHPTLRGLTASPLPLRPTP